MHRVLLGLALTVSLSVPASAEGFSAASGFSSLSAFGARGSGNLHTLKGRPAGSHGRFNGGHGRFDRSGGGFDGSHRRHIHVDDGFDGAPWGWGYYDGDYDGNRQFDPDLWNDWWHNRPDRAFPRWIANNQNCERIWYSGAGWRC
jgi:hypothetical protein